MHARYFLRNTGAIFASRVGGVTPTSQREALYIVAIYIKYTRGVHISRAHTSLLPTEFPEKTHLACFHLPKPTEYKIKEKTLEEPPPKTLQALNRTQPTTHNTAYTECDRVAACDAQEACSSLQTPTLCVASSFFRGKLGTSYNPKHL